MNRNRLISLAFIIAASSSLHSQTRPSANKPSVDATAPYATAPLDPATDSVPPNFRGHDIVALRRELAKLVKGEFETTQQFASRANFSTSTYRAFQLPNDSDCGGVAVAYDADKGEFQIHVPLSLASQEHAPYEKKNGVDTSGDFKGPAIQVRCVSSDSGSFIGTNNFGVRARVQSWTRDIYEVVQPRDSRWYSAVSSVSLTIPMAPADAAVLKGRLRAFVVGRASELSGASPTAEEQFAGTPTTERPFLVTVRRHFVGIAFPNIWIVNTKTGRVLTKVAVP